MWLRVLVVLLFVGANPVLGDKCWKLLDSYTSSFLDGSTMPYWAMQMFDASTKLPEGILAGNQRNMGNFDECVSLENVQTDAGELTGKHCLLDLELPLPLRHTQLKTTGISRMQRPDDLTKAVSVPVSVAMCVPSVCTTQDAELFTEMMWKLLFNITVTAKGQDMYCQVRDRPLKPTDWLTVMVLVALATLVVASTAYDLIITDKDRRTPLMVSFSVYTNGKRLLDTSVPRDSLTSVNGIRFFSISWIVLAHHYSVSAIMFINQAYFVEKVRYSWTQLYFTNAWLGVDTFFLLSGLLVAYIFFKTVTKTNSFDLPMFYIHRFIRLTPALAIFTLVACTVYRYVTSGPMWPFALSFLTRHCPRNWWAMLIYINNYYEPDKQCLDHSWYLSADMQLFWLSPLLLVPLWKKPRLGLWLGVFYIFLSILSPFLVTYYYELGTNAATIVFNGDPRIDDYNHLYYLPTHCRATVYIIGLLLGYFMFKFKTSHKIELTKVQIIGCWLLTIGMLLIGLLTIHPLMQADYKYNAVEAGFFNALHRPAWGLGLALLIALCTMGYGGIVNDFLSWKFFTPLTRLSYGVYLLHPLVLCMVFFSYRTTQYGEDVFLFPGHLGLLTTTFLTSVVFCLVAEMPFLIIEKELLGGHHTKKITKTEDDTGSPPIIAENKQVDDKKGENDVKCDIEIVVEPATTDDSSHDEGTSTAGIEQERASYPGHSEVYEDANSLTSSFSESSMNSIADERRPDIGFEAITREVLSEDKMEKRDEHHQTLTEDADNRNSGVEIVEMEYSPPKLEKQEDDSATNQGVVEEAGMEDNSDTCRERYPSTVEISEMSSQEAVAGGENEGIVTEDECSESDEENRTKDDLEEAEIKQPQGVSEPNENQVLQNLNKTIDDEGEKSPMDEEKCSDDSSLKEAVEQNSQEEENLVDKAKSVQKMFLNELKRVLSTTVSDDD